MSRPWKGLFPPHGPGVLGRQRHPTHNQGPLGSRDPILSPCSVTQHPAPVQILSLPTAVGIIFLQHFVMQSKQLFLLPASFKAFPCLLYLCSFNSLAPLPFQVQSHWSWVNNLQGLMCPIDPAFSPSSFWFVHKLLCASLRHPGCLSAKSSLLSRHLRSCSYCKSLTWAI